MWPACGMLLGPSLTVLKFHSLSQRGIAQMQRSVTRLKGVTSAFSRGFRSGAFVTMPIKVGFFSKVKILRN